MNSVSICGIPVNQGFSSVVLVLETNSDIENQAAINLMPRAYAVAETQNIPPCQLYQPHIKVTFPGLKLYIWGWAGTE